MGQPDFMSEGNFLGQLQMIAKAGKTMGRASITAC
jgi:hypothetical protein